MKRMSMKAKGTMRHFTCEPISNSTTCILSAIIGGLLPLLRAVLSI